MADLILILFSFQDPAFFFLKENTKINRILIKRIKLIKKEI